MLYYTADDGQFDFTALYLEEGHLVYSFDYGAGAVLMKSSAPINDNQWHQVSMVLCLTGNERNALKLIFLWLVRKKSGI